MTDFEIANQITDTMGLFLQNFAVLSTIFFAYVTGAFYFLNRAPLFTKIASFLFLVFAVLFISINMVGAFFHYTALIDQVELQVQQASVSFLIEAIHTGRTRAMGVAGLWTAGPVFIGMLAMCFWMTFIWQSDESAEATRK